VRSLGLVVKEEDSLLTGGDYDKWQNMFYCIDIKSTKTEK
jgi:hypothetical protein